MSDFTQPFILSESAISLSECLDSLRCACITLQRTSESVAGSMHLSMRVSPPTDLSYSLPDLACRVAEEYRMHAEVKQSGSRLNIRLRRSDDGACSPNGGEGTISSKEMEPSGHRSFGLLSSGWQLIQGARPGDRFLRIARRHGQKVE